MSATTVKKSEQQSSEQQKIGQQGANQKNLNMSEGEQSQGNSSQGQSQQEAHSSAGSQQKSGKGSQNEGSHASNGNKQSMNGNDSESMSNQQNGGKSQQNAGRQGGTQSSNQEIGTFIGELFAFNSSLKLYHWSVSGPGSYAKHMALDEALESVLDVIDRITETTYSLVGDLQITIPETKTPTDIVKHTSDFYNYVEKHRDLFPEDFSQSVIDDYQEAVQQLLYRLKRLQ